MNNQGWIKIYRKLIDSDIWSKKPSTWYKVWQYILLKVNHRDSEDFKKGQNFFNFRQELRSIGVDVTYSVVDHTMRFLKSAKQIATQKTTRGVIITVLNYNLYQNLNDEENETKSETVSEVKAKSLRNKSDTINKNDKNVKNNNINIISKNDGNLIKENINTFINLFKDLNPSYTILFKNKTQRDSVERLIKQYGEEKLKKMIEYLPSIVCKKFAPRITTPYELEMKMGQLKQFIQQERDNVRVGSIKV